MNSGACCATTAHRHWFPPAGWPVCQRAQGPESGFRHRNWQNQFSYILVSCSWKNDKPPLNFCDYENCNWSCETITHTFCHDQFHTGHDVCIYFVNPDPVYSRVIKLEVFDLHKESSSPCIYYMRSVSDSRLSATFWIHQNLTGAVRFAAAPVLFTKQEMFCVIFATECKFPPSVRCDLCWITAQLKSCYKRREKTKVTIVTKYYCFSLACDIIKHLIGLVWSKIIS